MGKKSTRNSKPLYKGHLHVFLSVPFIDRFDCNPFIFLIIDRTEKPVFLGYNFKWKNCVIFRPYAHQKICKMFHAHMKQQKYHMFLELVKQNLGKHGKSQPHPGICRLYWRESITMTNPTLILVFVGCIDGNL
jgi:hypothetical protein